MSDLTRLRAIIDKLENDKDNMKATLAAQDVEIEIMLTLEKSLRKQISHQKGIIDQNLQDFRTQLAIWEGQNETSNDQQETIAQQTAKLDQREDTIKRFGETIVSLKKKVAVLRTTNEELHTENSSILVKLQEAQLSSLDTCKETTRLTEEKAERDVYPYTAISVLFLCWKDDDLNVWPKIDKLKQVFEKDIGAITTTLQIPSEDPEKALQQELENFVAGKSRNTLLIIHYAGHGIFSNQELRFGANGRSSTSTGWSARQKWLQETDLDFLIILSSCHAGGSLDFDPDAPGLLLSGCSPARQELLAAGRFNVVTYPFVKDHFEDTLIDELRIKARSGKPFSTAVLFRDVTTRLARNTDFFGTVSAPVHILLGRDHNPSGIILKSFKHPQL